MPANVGLEGFLSTIRQILRRPRVQTVTIDSRGSVKFERWAADSEEDGNTDNNFGVDLTDLAPYGVVRNSRVHELVFPAHLSAPTTVALMFDRAAQDQLRPLAFVTGTNTSLWSWFRLTVGYELQVPDQFFGLPLLLDRQIPDTVLLLCAGLGRDAAFVDTRTSYKVEIPQLQVPATEVQVL